MAVDHWLAFCAASAVLLAIPGPTVLLVISYALGYGRRFAAATVAGVACGDFTAMTASMLGLGTLLTLSAVLFTVLKWIGAAYLMFLGIRLWRAPAAGDAPPPGGIARDRPARVFLHAYAVTALNPKSILFFVAFVPQFVDLTRALLPQLVIFEASFVTLATLNALGYALLAAAARQRIRNPRVGRAVNRLGGSLLIGAGAAALAWRRGA